MSAERIDTFARFWPYYLGEHKNPTCRVLHFVGTSGSMLSLVAAAALGRPLFVLVGLLCGYGFAWVGHFGFEKNRPATFRYPLYSLLADFKMWGYIATGRLAGELRAHGLV
jgi:hypothetical protein